MKLIESYTTIIGEHYELYSTGKGFFTRLIQPAKVRKNGKVVKEFITERRHTTLENALNSKLRGTAE